MKCLTIREPYASLIIHGIPDHMTIHPTGGRYKDIENRTWKAHYTGELGIHVAQTYYDGYRAIVEKYGKDFAERCKANRGHIIGTINMTGCVSSSKSSWFFGPYGFVLEDPRPIDPVKAKGALSFWNTNLLRKSTIRGEG